MKNYYRTILFVIAWAWCPLFTHAQVSADAISKDLLLESVKEVLGTEQPVTWLQKPISDKIKESLKGKLKIKAGLPDTLHLGSIQTDEGVRYIIPDIAPSKSEKYSYVLYLNSYKEVVDVDVLEYRENYGYEIDYDYFRDQFHGKKDPRKVRFQRTIQNISGATISARSLTYSVRDLLALMQKIQLP